ncbi:MAG: alpha-1,4-glucan--maltose-1-phosphate maltosyltransferase, partial [Thermoleophilia bacterium]|nr:alpha-1,4-glucan--maltose-1-phosphate maltosyltransferase [Thermoleophilia bacterium]
FHHVDNARIIAYSKRTPGTIDGVDDDTVLVIVNLDGHAKQVGTVDLDLAALGLAADTRFSVHDLLGGATYEWQGSANYVELDPAGGRPAHIFHVRQGFRRDEHDHPFFA